MRARGDVDNPGRACGAGPARGACAGFGIAVGPWAYARLQVGSVLHYLLLSFRPWPLVLDYGRPDAPDMSTLIALSIMLFALVAGAAGRCGARPRWGLAAAWVFVVLAPTSSVIPIADPVFEHRMYLPLAGLVACGRGGVHGRRLRAEKLIARERARRAVGWALAVVLAAAAAGALGAASFVRNKDYQSEMSIWTDTVAKSPLNARAEMGLGNALMAQRAQQRRGGAQALPTLGGTRGASTLKPTAA